MRTTKTNHRIEFLSVTPTFHKVYFSSALRFSLTMRSARLHSVPMHSDQLTREIICSQQFSCHSRALAMWFEQVCTFSAVWPRRDHSQTRTNVISNVMDFDLARFFAPRAMICHSYVAAFHFSDEAATFPFSIHFADCVGSKFNKDICA